MMSALFLAALAAASAQSAEDVGTVSTVKARQSIHAFGQCLANEQPKAVRALLATDFRDRTYGADLRRLVRRPAGCGGLTILRGAHAAGSLIWGGALAEGILRRDGILPVLASATAHDPARPTIEARNPGEFLAFCVLRTDPAGAAKLIAADPATAQEHAALVQLGSTLSRCVPANSQSRFTRDALRALIALGALRLALHNQTAVK